MRSHMHRDRDRASFVTPPYDEPAVMLAYAILELCHTIDDAAGVVAQSLNQTKNEDHPGQLDYQQIFHRLSTD